MRNTYYQAVQNIICEQVGRKTFGNLLTNSDISSIGKAMVSNEIAFNELEFVKNEREVRFSKGYKKFTDYPEDKCFLVVINKDTKKFVVVMIERYGRSVYQTLEVINGKVVESKPYFKMMTKEELSEIESIVNSENVVSYYAKFNSKNNYNYTTKKRVRNDRQRVTDKLQHSQKYISNKVSITNSQFYKGLKAVASQNSYKVIDCCRYEDGYGYQRISIELKPMSKFTPSLYISGGKFDNIEVSIQTTSWGTVDKYEAEKVIEGYQNAVNVAKFLDGKNVNDLPLIVK